MSYHPAYKLKQFTAEIALNASGERSLLGKYLEKYLAQLEIGEEVQVIIFPSPKNYCEDILARPVERARDGNWICACDIIHPRSEERCEICGDENLKSGRAYSKIHKKFGNMRQP